MAIDWEKFDKELDTILDEAADRTNIKLATSMSSVTRLTDEEIVEMFPNPADVKRLKNLLVVVKASTDRNTKVNSIINSIEEFADIIVKLVNKFA